MRVALALSLVLACAAASAGEVYKWRDKDGRLHYGDKPKDVQAESVMVKPPSNEPSPTFAAEKDRMAECQRRRAQLESWRSAPTMSEVDNLGRQREYSPAEREQFLAMTEAKVAELCAPPKGPVQPVEVFPPPEPPDPTIELPVEPAEEATPG